MAVGGLGFWGVAASRSGLGVRRLVDKDKSVWRPAGQGQQVCGGRSGRRRESGQVGLSASVVTHGGWQGGVKKLRVGTGRLSIFEI